MSKALELIRTLIDGANEYEKKTGRPNPTVYLSKNNLLIIEKALLKAQEQEKEKLLFKNIHNAKVKTPLVSIFNGLNQEERFKFIEHIYYHWEEMKEALEDKNNELEKENKTLKIKAEKEHKALEIIKEKPFILQKIFENKGLKNQQEYDKKYFWGTITQEEFDLLKEVLGE